MTVAVLSNALRVVITLRECPHTCSLNLTDGAIVADAALNSATSAQLLGEHVRVLDSASLMSKLELQAILAAESTSLPKPMLIPMSRLTFLLKLPGLLAPPHPPGPPCHLEWLI